MSGLYLVLISKLISPTGTVNVQASWKDVSAKEASTECYTLETGEQIQVQQAGQLRLDVSDSGAGMSPAQLKKLFGEGVQFNVNVLQAGQGSGLGLYISKGIVTQHRGSLRADSQGLDSGTTFTATLPLYRLPESTENLRRDPSESFASEDSREATSVHNRALKVLVVDDAAVNRKLLVRFLVKEGHYCDQAEDGLDAVEKVEEALESQYPYDVILMDYEMPRLCGPEATERIRSLGCDSFIFGVTGNVFPEDVANFKKRGANKVLSKPLSFPDLLETLMEFAVDSTCHWNRQSSAE